MGMSIDEVIKREKEIATKFQKAVDTHKASDDGFCKSLADYHKQIADTMRKYQKIEEIVNDRYGKPVFKTLDEVIKVVEDGKID